MSNNPGIGVSEKKEEIINENIIPSKNTNFIILF